MCTETNGWAVNKRVHYIELFVSAMKGTPITTAVTVGVAIRVRLAVPHRLEILA
jgi:hypothetical protein